MDKNRIKASILALLIAITFSSCDREKKLYDKNFTIDTINETNMSYEDINKLLMNYALSCSKNVDTVQFNPAQLRDIFSFMHNDINFNYAYTFLQNYLNFLIKYYGDNYDPTSYYELSKNDFGYMEQINYFDENGKYKFIISSTDSFNEKTSYVLNSYANDKFNYTSSYKYKYNIKSGSKLQHLNNADVSSSYSYDFYDENSVSISIINEQSLITKKNEYKYNDYNYYLMVFSNGELIENKTISEETFNNIIKMFNYCKENNLSYEEFLNLDNEITNGFARKITRHNKNR